MSESDLPTGFAVGPYRVERKLGEGGMGAVYLAAHHAIAHKRAAVKLLTGEAGASPASVARFKTEAEATALIGHRAIVDIYDWGRLDDGRHYLVMEYLEGESFAAWLARGTPAPAEVRELFDQVLDGLEAAHAAKVVHRDLKPENLFIVRPRHGGAPYAKILDFGIAKLIDADGASAASRTGTVLGTPFYMAPEQCRGQAVDHRADLYAIGVILYQTFAGVTPFRGDSAQGVLAQHLVDAPRRPSELATVPAGVEALILDCLKKSATERPADAGEVRRRLRAALSAADPLAAVPAVTLAAAPTVAAAPAETRAPGRRLWVAGVAVLGIAVAVWTGRAGKQAPSAAVAPTAAAPTARAAIATGAAAPSVGTTSPVGGAAPAGRAVRESLRRRGLDGAARTATPPADTAPRPQPTRAERHGLIETLAPGASP